MSGRRSRSKGARTERSIVNALLANGIAAVRVPLSGAVGGRFAVHGLGGTHAFWIALWMPPDLLAFEVPNQPQEAA